MAGWRRSAISGCGATSCRESGTPTTSVFARWEFPGSIAVQEYATYDVRTHHTNVDTYERVREQDLKQNAIVLAWFALQAANTTERIPRPADTRGQ